MFCLAWILQSGWMTGESLFQRHTTRTDLGCTESSFFLRGKAAGAWSYGSPPSNTDYKNACICTSCPHDPFMVLCLIKHAVRHVNYFLTKSFTLFKSCTRTRKIYQASSITFPLYLCILCRYMFRPFSLAIIRLIHHIKHKCVCQWFCELAITILNNILISLLKEKNEIGRNMQWECYARYLV